jgi:hypothetical protein
MQGEIRDHLGTSTTKRCGKGFSQTDDARLGPQ